MTNKITLSRELAERLDSDHSYVRNIARLELRTALAEPVPPTGGEPEVERHYGDGPQGAGMCYYVLASDFDRHVTRLQAEVERLKDSLDDACQMIIQNGRRANDLQTLIETLHANGDRIAMETIIAQQAQRIADLEAEKGQGEP